MIDKSKSSKSAPKNVESKAPVAPAKAPDKSKAPAVVVAFVAPGAATDAFNGRIGARTHAIHAALIEASEKAQLMTTAAITQRASALLGAPCNATASHLNTMSHRVLSACVVGADDNATVLTREGGAWRLTDEALALIGRKWGAAPEAPAKKKSKKK